MSDRKDVVRPDPELEEWLSDARAADARAGADYAAMFSSVQGEIARAEKRPSFWLRSRSTMARRVIAIGAAGAIAAVAAVLALRSDLADHPLHWAFALGALCALLFVSAHQALRPIHRPPLPAWGHALMIAATLGATFLIALLPPDGHFGAFPPPVSPCLFIGLLAGIPVYFVLRVLDRGQGSALLGACAAGLLGNLVLTLYCPSHDTAHLMLGHFSVAALFVAGLGLVHVLLRR